MNTDERRSVAVRLVLGLLLTIPLLADDRTQQLIARLSQQADTFQKVAPQMVGEETLFQRAAKAGQKGPQERRLVSVYTFGLLGGSVHEIRQVISIDGRPTQDRKKALEGVAKAVTSRDDARKKQ